MKKRNQKICDLVTNQGVKVQCAKFSCINKQLFASGDDKNIVSVYRIGRDKPIQLFSTSNQQQSSQVEVSAICFGPTEEDLFSGSNRGIINVWDLVQNKQSQTLKGHLASVNTIASFPSEEQKNLLLSGAYDTLIKLWDLRQKGQISQFKGHTNQINCLAVSPDGRLIASGSNDGTLKIWDMANPVRALNTFVQHDAPVTCVRYNPVDKALSSGANDRTVKYWDLDSYSLITTTKPDATPIQNIIFECQGRYLFSAAHESLKVWNLERDGSLLDNVESGWRGVLDLQLQEEHSGLGGTPTGLLYGLAAHGQQGFALYCVSLQSINFDTRQQQDRTCNSGNVKSSANRGKTPDQRQNVQQFQPLVNQQQVQMMPVVQQNQIKAKPNLSNNAKNILNEQNNYLNEVKQPQQQLVHQLSEQFQQPSEQPIYEIRPQSSHSQQGSTPSLNIINNNSSSNNNNNNNNNNSNNNSNNNNVLNDGVIHQRISLNKEEQYFQVNFNNLPVKQISSFEEEINPSNYNNQIMKEEIPQVELSLNSDLLVSNAELNFSSFIHGEGSKEKFKQIDTIGEIIKEHLKVMQILKGRESYMKPIVHWWNAGNSKSAVNAIMQINEANILLDAIGMLSDSKKLSSLGLDLIPGLVEKSRILIESRYMSHIRGGLEFVQQVINCYGEDLISVKGFATLSKMDPAREERIKKCDKLIEQFKIILTLPKIQKIIDKNREEVSEFTKKIQIQLITILKKVSQNLQ